MTSIVKTDHYVYEPTFDPDTDTYVDVCPYKKHERNRRIYNCNCKIGSNIHNIPSFNSHILSSCHKSYVQNYALFKKELNDEKEKNVKLTYDNEMLTRKNNKLEKDHSDLQEKYCKLNTQFTKFYTKSVNLVNKYKEILNDS